MTKKILITDIHHGNGGGHVTYILNLLHGLKGHYDLTLAAPPSGRLYKNAQAIEGIRVLPGLYTSRPLPLIAEVRRLRRFLKHERFDVVHVNGGADHRHVMFARLGLLHRPAIVWTKHNTNGVGSFGHRLRAALGTDISIAASEFVGRQLQASFYSRKPIQVIRNGISPAFFCSIDPQERYQARQALFGPLPDDVVVFGSTGGTDLDKGWMLLLQAASTLPVELRGRIRVVVAGDPPSERVMTQVRELGLQDRQVVFPGLVADVRGILSACDVGFVLSYREASSYACCEAMAMGLPALVSDAGGLPENLREGIDGWVVPVGNVQALAQRLRAILDESPAALAAKGASARERVGALFSTQSFLERTEQAYHAACLGVRGPAPHTP